MGEKFSLRERRGAAHLQRGRTEGRPNKDFFWDFECFVSFEIGFFLGF
jgi:hypothetical protein